MRKIISAFAGLAMLAGSTAAVAQSSAAPAPKEVAPAAESVEGQELRGGFILPLVVILLLLLGAKLGDIWPFKEDPKTP